MKHQVTPEQFNTNEDAPSTIVEYPIKALSLPYNAEAGAYASLALPNNFDKAIRVRAHFLKSGGATRMGLDIGFNFYPVNPTNFVYADVACDVNGPDGQVTTSDWCVVSAEALSGTMVSVKITPKLDKTTEDEATVVAMLEVDFGSF